jgi:hemin uptake protein HemP
MKLRMNCVPEGVERDGAPLRPDTAPMRVPLDTILRGRQEIIIQHRDEEYRLRITSNGKLLLTK